VRSLYSNHKSNSKSCELSKFPAIFHELLENGGADHIVRYRFGDSKTILHHLSLYADATNAHEILAVLANLPLTSLSELILAVNNDGASFIHHSFASSGFRKFFKPLLPKALQSLITLCNTQDDSGNIPLHFEQSDPVFNFLLKYTQNPFTLNHRQRSPLHILVATFKSWQTCRDHQFVHIQLLLRSKGVQEVKHVRHTKGQTLLHLCSDLQVLRELTKPQYGFLDMINAQDDEGQTPLVQVISHGRTYNSDFRPGYYYPSMWFVAEHFISCGADVSINDRFGRSALHWLLEAVDGCVAEFREGSCLEASTAIQALRDYRMARRLNAILLTKGVGVDDQDVDGVSAKALAEDYWDRWEESGIFKPRIISEHSALCLFISLGCSITSWWDYPTGIEYKEATSPEMARLRSELRGSGLNEDSPQVEWAELISRIIKGDLEALVNAIRSKSTRKRKRNPASGSATEVSGASEFALEFGDNDVI